MKMAVKGALPAYEAHDTPLLLAVYEAYFRENGRDGQAAPRRVLRGRRSLLKRCHRRRLVRCMWKL